MIARLAAQGFPARRVIALLGVSESGYYAWRVRVPSERSLRRMWLTGVIADIHQASGGRFGYRRVRRELVEQYGISVSDRTVQRLMNRARLTGKAGRERGAAVVGEAAGVRRGRWVVDVRVLPAVDGRVYAAVALDAASGRLRGFDTGPASGGTLTRQALTSALVPGAGSPRGAERAVVEAVWAQVDRALPHPPGPRPRAHARVLKAELDAAFGHVIRNQ
ncbi:IS3 family transposase [Streptomyces anandii]|uniref:IS3 family transposase n=1 Tax=Streptomyces anandii TaxID=285454 RepID=UPI00167B37EE|nr:IS3 family transposase [Streptomyces anandii]GGX97906.1 hypothetical protein GCM10010510_49250 [Streptomyces anandii JCM 4720]